MNVVVVTDDPLVAEFLRRPLEPLGHQLARHAGLPQELSECGVERSKLPELAADAARQWTGTFNPRDVGQTELLSLYERAY